MLLDRLLTHLSVTVEPFAVCEVERDCRLDIAGDDAAVLHFVVAGRGELVVGGEAFPLAERTLVLVPRHLAQTLSAEASESSVDLVGEGLTHLRALGPNGRPDVVVACGRVVVRFDEARSLFQHLQAPIRLDFADSDAMATLFAAIIEESGPGRPGRGPMLEALMTRCLVLMLRRLCGSDDCPLPWLAALEDPQLSVALDAMLDDVGRRHSLESLAEVSAMSRSRFAAAFKEAFGVAPMTFLRDLRLRKAAELLGSAGLTVEGVAQAVGFSSRSHFSVAFSERFGSSPAEYRDRAVAGAT